jgi:hypothetical protein
MKKAEREEAPWETPSNGFTVSDAIARLSAKASRFVHSRTRRLKHWGKDLA